MQVIICIWSTTNYSCIKFIHLLTIIFLLHSCRCKTHDTKTCQHFPGWLVLHSSKQCSLHTKPPHSHPLRWSRAGRSELCSQCLAPPPHPPNRHDSDTLMQPMTAAADQVTLTGASAKLLWQLGHGFHGPGPCLGNLVVHTVMQVLPAHVYHISL